MIVAPKVRGFICTTAHPTGCEAHIKQWIDYVKAQTPLKDGPKKVLVIGASTGFGLASRISAAFGTNASTIGVFFERPSNGKKTASAGWYNTAAFEKAAHAQGLYAKSINGDAFSNEIKQQTLDLIKKDWNGEVDLVIYSIASPRRTDPTTATTYSSVLKPIGKTFENKTVDVHNGHVSDIAIEPATDDDIQNTVHVMGGDDWQMWMDLLMQENCLAEGAKTVAFTYIGPKVTHAIYRQGTIGRAKEHLEQTAAQLDKAMQAACHGRALISVNKALVTQASAAIPVVPLYISMLYKIMKEKNIHEGCAEQMWRLFNERLYGQTMPLDEKGRIRVDDWEMRDDVQAEIAGLWDKINSDNLESESDLQGYRDDFYRLFGFGLDGINYDQDVDVTVPIESIKTSEPQA